MVKKSYLMNFKLNNYVGGFLLLTSHPLKLFQFYDKKCKVYLMVKFFFLMSFCNASFQYEVVYFRQIIFYSFHLSTGRIRMAALNVCSLLAFWNCWSAVCSLGRERSPQQRCCSVNRVTRIRATRHHRQKSKTPHRDKSLDLSPLKKKICQRG